MVNKLGVKMPFRIICILFNLTTKLHIILKRFVIKSVKNDNYLVLVERKMINILSCSFL